MRRIIIFFFPVFSPGSPIRQLWAQARVRTSLVCTFPSSARTAASRAKDARESCNSNSLWDLHPKKCSLVVLLTEGRLPSSLGFFHTQYHTSFFGLVLSKLLSFYSLNFCLSRMIFCFLIKYFLQWSFRSEPELLLSITLRSAVGGKQSDCEEAE